MSTKPISENSEEDTVTPSEAVSVPTGNDHNQDTDSSFLHLVKLYFLDDVGNWQPEGVGTLTLSENGRLLSVLDGEVALLETDVTPDDSYRSSEETILMWHDSSLQREVALAFQSRAACQETLTILECLQVEIMNETLGVQVPDFNSEEYHSSDAEGVTENFSGEDGISTFYDVNNKLKRSRDEQNDPDLDTGVVQRRNFSSASQDAVGVPRGIFIPSRERNLSLRVLQGPLKTVLDLYFDVSGGANIDAAHINHTEFSPAGINLKSVGDPEKCSEVSSPSLENREETYPNQKSMSDEQKFTELHFSLLALYEHDCLLPLLGNYPIVLESFLAFFPSDASLQNSEQSTLLKNIVHVTRLVLSQVCARPNHNIFVSLLGSYEAIRRLIRILEFDSEINPRGITHDSIVSGTIDTIKSSDIPWSEDQLRKVKYIYALSYLRESVAPRLVEDESVSGGALPAHLNKMRLECYRQVYQDKTLMRALCKKLTPFSLGVLYEIMSLMKTNFFQLAVREEYFDTLLANRILYGTTYVVCASSTRLRGAVSDLWYQLAGLRTEKVREYLISEEEVVAKFPLLHMMLDRVLREGTEPIAVQWRETFYLLLSISPGAYSTYQIPFRDIFLADSHGLLKKLMEASHVAHSRTQLSLLAFCIRTHWNFIAQTLFASKTLNEMENYVVNTKQSMGLRLAAADVLRDTFTACSRSDVSSLEGYLISTLDLLAERRTNNLLRTSLLSIFTTLYQRRFWDTLLALRDKSDVFARIPPLLSLTRDIEEQKKVALKCDSLSPSDSVILDDAFSPEFDVDVWEEQFANLQGVETETLVEQAQDEYDENIERLGLDKPEDSTVTDETMDQEETQVGSTKTFPKTSLKCGSPAPRLNISVLSTIAKLCKKRSSSTVPQSESNENVGGSVEQDNFFDSLQGESD